jgi:hypothetical protein
VHQKASLAPVESVLKTINAPPLFTLPGRPTDQRGEKRDVRENGKLREASHLAIAGHIHTHRHAIDVALGRQQQMREEDIEAKERYHGNPSWCQAVNRAAIRSLGLRDMTGRSVGC